MGVKVNDEMMETMAHVLADCLCSSLEASGESMDEPGIERVAAGAAVEAVTLLRNKFPVARDFLVQAIPMLEAALATKVAKGLPPLKGPVAASTSVDELMKIKGDKPGVVIGFTPQKLKGLKRAYAEAVDANLESFMFDGHEWATSYAKYTIEFVSGKFKEMSND